METRSVDVAIIGAGTAGLNARRAALKHGASVLLIEGGPYGTTCARVGCMPSKLLIAAADAAHELHHASQFGVRPSGVTVDGPAVLDRVRRERDRFAGFVVKATEGLPAAEKLRGRARFVGPAALQVELVEGGGSVQVDAKAVIIATGSSPWDPPVLHGAGDRLLHNDDVFELPDLPASMAVIGTGIIGIELGQALHRLGVSISLFTIDDMIGPMTDPAVKRSAQQLFGGELDLHLDVTITTVERTAGGVRLGWTDQAGQGHQAEHQLLLAASGRQPNVADLDLEPAGLRLDGRGVPVFDERTMQCGAAPVFIAGDATGQRPLLHEAADEGQIAGTNAARFPEVEPAPRRIPLTIVFSDPQMAIVGPRYTDLERDGVDFEIGEVDYGDQGRARIMGCNAGSVRVYGEPQTGTFLGAEMLGPRVEHTAHLLAWAAQLGLRVDEILRLPFYHPVVEEGIRGALRDLKDKMDARATARR